MAKKENKFVKVIRSDDQDKNFGLGRPFYFDNWYNRIALMGTLLSTIILLIFRQVTGTGTGSIMTDGVSYAAGFFFAYLIGLEADPEPGREWGSLIGAFLTLGGEAFFGVNSNGVVGLLWVLFICRMFNRTSGSRHYIGDNLLILASAFWLGTEGFWLFPIATGIAYILESQLKEGYYRSLYLGAVAFAMCIITGRNMEVPVLSTNYLYLMAIAFVLFLPQFTMAGFTTARDDRENRLLQKTRLQSAQAFLLLGCDMLIYFGGNVSGQVLLPCIMATIGTGIYLLIDLLKKKQAEEQK